MFVRKNYPDCEIELIPGICSLSAAAAKGLWPLSLQQDQLLVLPTPDDPLILEELLKDAATSNRVLALLKLGNRWLWVRPLLERLNLLKGSLFAERVGFVDEQVMPADKVEASVKNYFSLLLIRQTWPDTLP